MKPDPRYNFTKYALGELEKIKKESEERIKDKLIKDESRRRTAERRAALVIDKR